MALSRKSKQQEPDIADLYAARPRAIWEGMKREHVSFWFLCLYFFFEYVRPQSIYPVLEAVPWSTMAMFGAIVAAISDPAVKWVGNVENRLFVAFAIIIILSGIFAYIPRLSWHDRNIMLSWFIAYFLVINIVNSERRFFLFTLAFLFFSFKMSQHGFLSWAKRGFSFASWGLIGAGGWFQNSGEFAIQMLIMGTLSSAFVVALKRYWGRYKRWFFYLMPFTAFMSVIGASSRGSQLALAVIGVVVLLKAKAGIKVLVPLVLIASIGYYFLPPEQKARFESMGDDKTSQQRLQFWEFGLDVMKKYPVLGIGYSNWWMYYYQSDDSDHWVLEPHNIFIKAGAELGYTGLIVFTTMIVYVFVINVRTRRMAKARGNEFFYIMAYGLDAGLVGYLVAGFFVTVLYYPFFWVQMAMTVAANSIVKGLPEPKTTGNQEAHAGMHARRPGSMVRNNKLLPARKRLDSD